MSDILTIIRFVGGAVWHVLPFFLASIFLSVLINTLDLKPAIRRAFDARVGLSVLLATAVGAFSPFCSCSVVPVIAGLLASGVPLAPVMSFWIASPTMDPEIFALSVGVLGWPLALARLGATLALSLGAGYLTLALGRLPYFQSWLPEQALPARAQKPVSCCAAPASPLLVALPVLSSACCAGDAPAASLSLPLIRQPAWWQALSASFRRIDWLVFLRRMAVQSWQLGRWLLVAFVLEALITLYVPQQAIAGILGQHSRFAVPLAALVGIPLYLGNLSALPIVQGLLAQGMSSGAAIAFLLAGPVTTVPAMAAVWGVVRKRVFVLYVGISLFGAILLGYIVNWIL